MLLTAARLRQAKACGDEVEIFEREWPEGCRITPATIARAVELDLDVGWAALYLPGLALNERRAFIAASDNPSAWSGMMAAYALNLALAERRAFIAASDNPSYWSGMTAAHAPGLAFRQRRELIAASDNPSYWSGMTATFAPGLTAEEQAELQTEAGAIEALEKKAP